MIQNGYLIFEDESFLDSTVAKMNALRKNGQFCDVRLQVWFIAETCMVRCTFSEKPPSYSVNFYELRWSRVCSRGQMTTYSPINL